MSMLHKWHWRAVMAIVAGIFCGNVYSEIGGIIIVGSMPPPPLVQLKSALVIPFTATMAVAAFLALGYWARPKSPSDNETRCRQCG